MSVFAFLAKALIFGSLAACLLVLIVAILTGIDVEPMDTFDE